MVFTHLLAVAALSLSTSATVYQGFNYGATQTDGSVKQQSDFQSEFQTAKGLVGASGFTSARLYTMIQGGTTSDPTTAIPAAIAEDTTLLLGIWASAGETVVNNEIAALKSAIDKYGSKFTDLVVGISVGSEDLYRDSQMGIDSHAGIGTGPDTIISYVKQVRSAISGTTLSKAPIGHVDTWTAWTNGSIAGVVDAVDWLGVDAYPYFQNTMANSISDAQGLFNDALGATQGAAKGKPVWVTETGYPVSGSKSNLAVPSLENAKTYWDEVGCALFGKTNTWWYTLQDADPTTPDPSFGLVSGQLSTTPLFNLTCPSGSKSVLTGAAATSSASSSSSSSTTTGKGSSSNGTSTTAGSTSSPSTGSGSSASSGSSSGSSSSTGSSSGSSTGASNGTSAGSPSGSASGSASGPLHTGAATANSASVVTVMGAIAVFLAFF